MVWFYLRAIVMVLSLVLCSAQFLCFADLAWADPCDPSTTFPGICLDPGHGGPTAHMWSPPGDNGDGLGSYGPGPDSLTEVWVNHEIVSIAYPMLQSDTHVICTKTSMTRYMARQERCDIANQDLGVDVFISVHHEGDIRVTDTRVFYADNDYIPNPETGEWKYKLAEGLATGINDKFGYDWQVKPDSESGPGEITVLQRTRMPAALSEASCIKHQDEEDLMAYDYGHRLDEACGIVAGVKLYEEQISPLYFTCSKTGTGTPPLVKYVFSWNAVEGADGYILYGQGDVGDSTCPPTQPTMCFDVGSYTQKILLTMPDAPVFAVRSYVEGPLGRISFGGFSDCVGWWSTHTTCFGTAIDRMISNFTATGGDHQVTLSWHAVSFEEWVEFEIWRSMNGGQSYDDSVGCVEYDRNQDDYTFVDTSTGYGMTYYYKIRDTEGYAWWGPASASPVSGVVPPPAPSPTPVLAIDYLDDQMVHVCLEQGSQYADFYNLWWQPEGGSWEAMIHGGDQCVEFSELQNGMPYCFVAQGQNQAGTTKLSSMVWAVPMLRPTNLHDVAGHECIDLWWDGSPFASGYRVYYSTIESDPFQNSVDVEDTTATTLTGLDNGTLYILCVVAYDQFANETAPSNSVSSRPECWAGIADSQDVPSEFDLGGSYPNPFGSSTAISYQLPKPCADVRLVIYDTMGREVRRIVNEGQPAGRYEVSWDGRDRAGRDLPSGVYFYRLDAGGFSKTEKMLLVR